MGLRLDGAEGKKTKQKKNPKHFFDCNSDPITVLQIKENIPNVAISNSKTPKDQLEGHMRIKESQSPSKRV